MVMHRSFAIHARRARLSSAFAALVLLVSGRVSAQGAGPEPSAPGDATDEAPAEEASEGRRSDDTERAPERPSGPPTSNDDSSSQSRPSSPAASSPTEADPPGSRVTPAASFRGTTARASQPGSQPQLLHDPPSTAEADEPLEILAELVEPTRVRHAWLVFRAAGESPFRQVEFLRSERGPYLAVVDPRYVKPPHLDYVVEVELRDGSRRADFASRSSPHRIQVPRDEIDVVEEALDHKVESRRNVFFAGGDYVSFGTSRTEVPDAEGQLHPTDVSDWYYRVEAGYTHRLLGWISEFGIRGGVVRGSAPVPVRELQPGQDESERFDVGLNYGAPWVRFRFADVAHADAHVLLSVNEIGFQLGAGGALHIGDPYGSKLTLGVEGVQQFGMRFYTQVDIQAHERIRVAPILEVTNAPSADRYGIRILGEIGVDVGYGFGLVGRGGYQARTFTSGGPSAGGALSYAF